MILIVCSAILRQMATSSHPSNGCHRREHEVLSFKTFAMWSAAQCRENGGSYTRNLLSHLP
ncbi:hypothetical protein PVAP13_2KG441600 [Panicum virgatum]|uniref:Uncharacterized protein n=1 Tax=Panicum virgatum TaxID=38727 RepID=A0A8T0WM21_PANVG|nr:hypothetical protein PVAP13_2KG441600 [Panicum virgatum]KAG2645714.1 hypothetical protein PVAP13_2KG441600 [Panicum virgatum]